MINVHASGGRPTLEAAKEALSVIDKPPLLIAVTVLTSFADEDLRAIGIPSSAQQQTLKLALLANSVGLDGVVCSATDAGLLRQVLGEDPLLVTPGIRLGTDIDDDQKRIMTPLQAIEAGSDYLVIGRPITRAKDPVAILHSIHAQISSVN